MICYVALEGPSIYLLRRYDWIRRNGLLGRPVKGPETEFGRHRDGSLETGKRKHRRNENHWIPPGNLHWDCPEHG